MLIDGDVVEQRAELIGHAGAAEAEYRALVLGLELARSCGVEEVEVRCDSQLAVRAIRAGAPVAAPVLEAARGFGSVRWVWHPRDENEAADALVRELLWPTTPVSLSVRFRRPLVMPDAGSAVPGRTFGTPW